MKQVAIALLILIWVTDLHAQALFYQGKTVRVIVGGTAPNNCYEQTFILATG
jgi:hypothetical protein